MDSYAVSKLANFTSDVKEYDFKTLCLKIWPEAVLLLFRAGIKASILGKQQLVAKQYIWF